jgi:hypothetical protein
MLDECWKEMMDELAAEEDKLYSGVGDDDDDDDIDRLEWEHEQELNMWGDFGGYISESDEDSDDEDEFREICNTKNWCGRA